MTAATSIAERAEAMTATKSVTRYCGAKTRKGGTCRREAGWGTDHPRRGPCKLHGGATTNHRKRAQREEAMEFAVNALGAEIALDPLEGLLWSVRLASGTVAFWRAKLMETPTPSADVIEGYMRAVGDLNRFSKTAVEGGVAEKLVALAGRAAEQIVLAAEEALTAVKIDAAERAKFVRAFAGAISKLESNPPLELPSGDSATLPAWDGSSTAKR